jgi:hypothetical protein
MSGHGTPTTGFLTNTKRKYNNNDNWSKKRATITISKCYILEVWNGVLYGGLWSQMVGQL